MNCSIESHRGQDEEMSPTHPKGGAPNNEGSVAGKLNTHQPEEKL